jgi:hypothetical protein
MCGYQKGKVRTAGARDLLLRRLIHYQRSATYMGTRTGLQVGRTAHSYTEYMCRMYDLYEGNGMSSLSGDIDEPVLPLSRHPACGTRGMGSAECLHTTRLERDERPTDLTRTRPVSMMLCVQL